MSINRFCQKVQSVIPHLTDFLDEQQEDKLSWARRHLCFCPECGKVLKKFEEEHPEFWDKIPVLFTKEEMAKKAEERYDEMKRTCQSFQSIIPQFLEKPPNFDNRDKILPLLPHMIGCFDCREAVSKYIKEHPECSPILDTSTLSSEENEKK